MGLDFNNTSSLWTICAFYTYILTYIHTYIYTYIHTTYLHTHIPTYTPDTYIHTYIHLRVYVEYMCLAFGTCCACGVTICYLLTGWTNSATERGIRRTSQGTERLCHGFRSCRSQRGRTAAGVWEQWDDRGKGQRWGGGGRERGGRKRLEQLATQVEDLNYQVSMLNEELEDKQKQLETFQVTLDFFFFFFFFFVHGMMYWSLALCGIIYLVPGEGTCLNMHVSKHLKVQSDSAVREQYIASLAT